MTSVKVRIAVAVNEHGDWFAYGSSFVPTTADVQAKARLADASTVHWVAVEQPIPEPVEVEGSVTP